MREHPEAAVDDGRSIAGKIVLVAGPPDSLAPSIARAARQRGARAVLAGPAPSGAAADAATADLCGLPGSESEADRLFQGVLDRVSRLDALIAIIPTGPVDGLHELALQGWHERVTDPLRHAFWLAQRAVDEFLAAGNGGRMVFVAEPASRSVPEERNEVVETALVSLARSIAKEYGRRGVTCNVVLPAGRAPDVGSHAGDPLLSVVETVLFLASPGASFISGESLVVHARAD